MPGDGATLSAPTSGIKTRSQGGISSLLVVQREHFQSVGRICKSAERLTASSTFTTVSTKRQTLDHLFDKCRAVHQELIECTPSDDIDVYLKEDEFGIVETRYLDTVDHLTALQDQVAPSTSTGANITTVAEVSPTSRFSGLQRIAIPVFHGDRNDWPQFKDMFESMVLKEPNLSKVQKFYYLKTSLAGPALALIKNILMTGANFDDAWNQIVSHYQDVQALTFSLINRLLKLKPASGSNSSTLESLVSQTREIIISLKNIKEYSCDSILVVMTLLRLDPDLRENWEEKVGKRDTFPKYDELETFLNNKIHTLNVASVKPGISSWSDNSHAKFSKSRGNDSNVTTHVTITEVPSCYLCSEAHSIAHCRKLKSMSPTECLDTIRNHRLCFNCLNKGHIPSTCKRKSGCTKCTRRHHPILHDALSQWREKPPASALEGSSSMLAASHSGVINPGLSQPALIGTAWVRARTPEGNEISLRAILDSGSECSLLSENAAQTLRVRRVACPASISGIGGTVSGVVKHATRLELHSQVYNNNSVSVNVYILPKLSSYAPRRYVKVSNWTNVSQLLLADPEPCGTQPIDLILGMDCYDEIVLRDKLKFPGEPLAVQSQFGWLLRGPIEERNSEVASGKTITALHVTLHDELNHTIERFWEVEEIPKQSHLTFEEQKCEEIFAKTTTRDATGRYTVALPFNSTPPLELGNSFNIAKIMFDKMERRLERDPDLTNAYNEFLAEYMRLDHMRPYTPLPNEQNYYIPHHPVIKPSSSSTKVRVVFNASARSSNGKSLNDHLLVGPKLQQDLPAIVLRWRRHEFACSADVQKMFRQIRVREEDTRYQLILYRCPETKSVFTCRLTTVTYGTASAPYQSQRVLAQLAADEKNAYPLAASEVIENTFVDDTFFGASTLERCREIRAQIIDFFSSGGFDLHKWSSNCADLLADLPNEVLEPAHRVDLEEDSFVKILGICWDPRYDVFEFKVAYDIPPLLTKRTFLSFVSKLYDPLGWLSPIVIVGKILIQNLWLLAISWDAELPDEVARDCRVFCGELRTLSQVRIPRWLSTNDDSIIEIHGFADASQKAYAAVVYLRVHHAANSRIFLLTSKSRVAPLKVLSIPRLELCAAELLSRLLIWTINTLKLPEVPIFAWTDSTVVLAWIRKSPSNWKVFVGNRVSKIQTLCPRALWRHVPTHDNPADLASRGIRPDQILENSLWWNGPVWLSAQPETWPSFKLPDDSELIDLESRTAVVHVVNSIEWELASRFSDWAKLVRITSLILRFVNNARRKRAADQVDPTVQLIREAKEFWVKYIQRLLFATEIELLEKGQTLPKSSPLSTLDPYLDHSGIICMRGRLTNAPLTFSQKFPAILGNCQLTRLLVRHAHLRCLHGGTSLTARLLREDFWIIRSKVLVRSVINKCVTCARHRATLGQQQMAPLPNFRVNIDRAFLKVGIDYAGPISVRAFSGRGHQSRKTYVAVFVCMVTRAIHIELVTDLTSAAFIAAFRRFTSRRGLPIIVLSDNGTNFQGGQAELLRIFRTAMTSPDIAKTMLADQIEWRFIPPSSPHFGGMWEAGVKSVKHHLRRIIGVHTLTIAEMETLLCQVEACLNSRPLAGLSNDPDDLSYLTPGHFLIGAPILSLPEPTLLSKAESSLSRYQLVQQMRDRFWKVWRLDYLHTLQKRSKWRTAHPNFKIGDIVVVKSDTTPPTHWDLARVTDCFQGEDGLVRVCEIKTATSTLRRAIHKLCPLPVTEHE